jgi:hypothetical protein
MSKKKILIITTSVFTDRMYQHSTFLDNLKKEFLIELWAKSVVSNPNDWEIEGIEVKPIPEVNPLKHWINILRRINEFAWMYSLKARSLEINQKYMRNQKKITVLCLFINWYLYFSAYCD